MADGGERRSSRTVIAGAADSLTRKAADISTATRRMVGTMASSRKDDLIAWLRDAHAMEAATTDNLERLIARVDKYPQLKTHMQHHLEVSRRQTDEIEQQLKALGSDTSTLKDMAMRLTGRLEPVLSGVTADDMPKHCIAAQSWEQFEDASFVGTSRIAQELCTRAHLIKEPVALLSGCHSATLTASSIKGYINGDKSENKGRPRCRKENEPLADPKPKERDPAGLSQCHRPLGGGSPAGRRMVRRVR
ncbi:MAG: ferritin-like domain-containing protein [Stellaceae bacterium]